MQFEHSEDGRVFLLESELELSRTRRASRWDCASCTVSRQFRTVARPGDGARDPARVAAPGRSAARPGEGAAPVSPGSSTSCRREKAIGPAPAALSRALAATRPIALAASRLRAARAGRAQSRWRRRRSGSAAGPRIRPARSSPRVETAPSSIAARGEKLEARRSYSLSRFARSRRRRGSRWCARRRACNSADASSRTSAANADLARAPEALHEIVAIAAAAPVRLNRRVADRRTGPTPPCSRRSPILSVRAPAS